MKLFDYIHDLLANADTLLFILIGPALILSWLLDEVESLSASRKASLSGSEPSDGMRVVNALLTQVGTELHIRMADWQTEKQFWCDDSDHK